MAKRKLTATQKLRQNVKRQIRRMEERGYRIDAGIKEKIELGKYQTLKAIQRNKYAKLYEESLAEVEGKIVSGTVRKAVDRKEAAKRGAKTRERNLYGIVEEYDNSGNLIWQRDTKTSPPVNTTWESQRRLQDEIDRRNAMMYSEGEIAYDNIMKLINDYPTKGSQILKREITREISKYGRDNVIMSMGQVPENVIANAQNIVFYEGDADDIASAIQDFMSIISGTIPDENDAKEMGEMMDRMTDFSTYED